MSLLFNIFFSALIHMAFTHFEADKHVVDAALGLKEEIGTEGWV